MRPVSIGKNLVAGTTTMLYEIPRQNVGKCILLFAHNETSSAKNFSAWWYDKSANTEIAIVDGYQLASKAFLKFDGSYVVFDEGDELRVLAEAGSICSVIATFELEYKPSNQNGT